MELTCPQVARVMWEYLDDELPDATRLGVLAHLDRCKRCKAALQLAGRFLNAVRRVRPRKSNFPGDDSPPGNPGTPR